VDRPQLVAGVLMHANWTLEAPRRVAGASPQATTGITLVANVDAGGVAANVVASRREPLAATPPASRFTNPLIRWSPSGDTPATRRDASGVDRRPKRARLQRQAN
jgi:hypothetical protein